MEAFAVIRSYYNYEDSYTDVIAICYTEDKCKEVIEKDKQKNSWERRKSARELCDYKGYSCFNGLWILDLQDYCGGPDDELFCSFMNYVTDYISDLHMGNVGYIDGKPVLVDYSGFDS